MSRTRAVAWAAAAAILGVATASWELGSRLTAPVPREIRVAPRAWNAVTITLATGPGRAIRGWRVAGEPGRGTIVLAHSVRSDRREMIGRAEFLRHAGYTLLLFDQQAHGESTGERVTLGWREVDGARVAVESVRALGGPRVGYLGVSQGGAAALLGALPLAVDALVLEAVYPTLREAVTNRIAIRVGPLAPLLAPLLLLQIEPRLGVSPDDVAPIEGIRRIQAPLLLIAGAEDRHTTLAQSQRLFDAAPAPKELWVLPGAAHVDFHRFAAAEYERRLLDFFARTLAD